MRVAKNKLTSLRHAHAQQVLQKSKLKIVKAACEGQLTWKN